MMVLPYIRAFSPVTRLIISSSVFLPDIPIHLENSRGYFAGANRVALGAVGAEQGAPSRRDMLPHKLHFATYA
jgi:hypothetical protein